MTEPHWYQEGLRFECTQCGDCCTGAPGYVWVNPEEVTAIAAVIGESDTEAFREKYTRRVGTRTTLLDLPNGDCIFFDNQARRCTVYAARPAQCRTWPFWDSNLKSSAAWKQTCQVCPGSGQGKLYSVDQIESQRKVVKV